MRPRAARRTAALVLAAAVALGACTNDGAGAPAGAPATTDTPASATPTPTLEPVVGERTSAVFPLGGRPVLGLGSDPQPNKKAIRRAVEQVGDWLDAHLDELQRDGGGLWGQVASKGLAGPKQRRLVTTGLASPNKPVARARYVMSVYHDGDPRYVATKVVVTHPDGSRDAVGLVFVVDGGATPRLTMFGPESLPKKAKG